MAAILCQGIGNCFSSLCRGCGEVCKAPCRLISCCCEPFCKSLSQICQSPFCFYVTVAVFLNAPPIGLGARTIPYLFSSDCRGSQWSVVNMCLCACHIAAAFYLFNAITRRDDLAQSTAIGRASHLMCYDPIIAIYILISIGFVGWLFVGITWSVSGLGSTCPENIDDLVNASIGCGFSFLSIGCCAMFISFCVASCDKRDYGDRNQNSYSPYNAPQPQQLSSSAKPGYDQQQIPTATAVPYNASYSNSSMPPPIAPPTKIQADNAKSASMPQPIPSPVVDGRPVPNAPTLSDTDIEQGTSSSQKGGSIVGSKFGKKVGKLFGADSKQQANLEQQGAKAGETLSQQYQAAKKFVSSIGKKSDGAGENTTGGDGGGSKNDDKPVVF